MADSDITLSGLAATGGVGQVALTWSLTGASCLPYLQIDKVEIWVAITNNRANAAKVGEIFGTQWVHAGLGKSTTRYYWVRARDASGNLGDFFPASTTAGVAGTTTSNAPSPSTVSDIVDNLGNITAGNIAGVTITGSLLRTVATGMRIEISAGQNAINFYNSSNQIVGQIRAITGNTMLTLVGNSQPAPIMSIDNGGNGAAARFSGIGANPGVLDVENTANGSGRDGARVQNSGSGGGAIFLGRAGSNGGYAAYSVRGGFAPFTGQHEAFLLKGVLFDFGDIVVDERVVARNGIDDTLTIVALSEHARQRAALGVISRRTELDPMTEFAALWRGANELGPTWLMQYLAAKFDLLAVNSLGEGQINVCGRNGNLEKGDLLETSTMRGKAQRQGDEFVRSTTVAKAREDVIFDYPDQWRRVACIYLCG